MAHRNKFDKDDSVAKTCIVCEKPIRRCATSTKLTTRRSKYSVTCSKPCSKIYTRIYQKINNNIRRSMNKDINNSNE